MKRKSAINRVLLALTGAVLLCTGLLILAGRRVYEMPVGSAASDSVPVVPDQDEATSPPAPRRAAQCTCYS